MTRKHTLHLLSIELLAIAFTLYRLRVEGPHISYSLFIGSLFFMIVMTLVFGLEKCPQCGKRLTKEVGGKGFIDFIPGPNPAEPAKPRYRLVYRCRSCDSPWGNS